MRHIRKSVVLAFVTVIALVVVPVALAQETTPSVTVNDQEIQDGTVTVAEVVSDGAGWIVIHADDNGAPGPVIGQAAVSDGTNQNVSVQIDTGAATETLYAMLHTDSGEMGTYEFPDADPPVQVDGSVVVQPFSTAVSLPESGTTWALWTALTLIVAGVLILAAGFAIRLGATRKARVRE